MKHYTTTDKCRVCGAELEQVLYIEPQYVGTTFVKDNSKHPMSKVKIPMTLMLCRECKLVQLRETTDPELLYRDYYYRTGVNDTMRQDLKGLVEDTLERIDVKAGDIVVDIGSNDGTMLGFYPKNLCRLGVEPAKNIDWTGLDKSIVVVNDYFTKEAVEKKIGRGKKAKIITSCACFYDMDDPNKITQDIKELLDENGICVIQVSYLLDTVESFNIYDIVGEHLEYFSLESITNLMKRHELDIFDVERNFVNGGSIRLYICHAGKREKSSNYDLILRGEKRFNLGEIETYQRFSQKIEEVSRRTNKYLSEKQEQGKKIYGLGASTKANVLIQLYGLEKYLPAISERSKIKIGLRTLGTDIPLIAEEKARYGAEIFVVFPWNFSEEIISREMDFLKRGGELFFILPEPHCVWYDENVGGVKEKIV